MEKQMLRCDICGGTLRMQANKGAVCENCGMTYSIESLRDKFNGLKVSVTGSNEDVAQWRVLLQTYLENCDYSAAESVVKKILEAIPSDEYAHSLYKKLQSWKEFEVKNRQIIQYNGTENEVIIPCGVLSINTKTFDKYRGQNPLVRIEKITIPEGIRELQDGLFSDMKYVKCIALPKTIIKVGNYAFSGCQSLREIAVFDCVETIGDYAFQGCGLTKVELPEGLNSLGSGAFQGSSIEEIKLPNSLISMGDGVFRYCALLKCVVLPEGLSELPDSTFEHSGLQMITIPENIKTIGDSCFRECKNLLHVALEEDKGTKNFRFSSHLGARNPITFSKSGIYTRRGAITTTSDKRTRTECFDDQIDYNQTCFSSGGYTDWRDGSIHIEYVKVYEWKKQGLCAHCGGQFIMQTTSHIEFFKRVTQTYSICKTCGIRKDYY